MTITARLADQGLMKLLAYIDAARPSPHSPWRDCEIREMEAIISPTAPGDAPLRVTDEMAEVSRILLNSIEAHHNAGRGADRSAVETWFRLLERPVNRMEAALNSAGDGWIACSERIPEDDVRVCIYETHWNEQRFAIRYEGRWYTGTSGDSINFPVTHWRPLPPPPTK